MKKLNFSALFVLMALYVSAQDASADEQAIRNLIAHENQGKNVIQSTDDFIFVSGPHRRHTIGSNNPERQAVNNFLPKVRSNTTTKRDVVRLVVAKSGDIAYEFGNGSVSYDTLSKEHAVISGRK